MRNGDMRTWTAKEILAEVNRKEWDRLIPFVEAEIAKANTVETPVWYRTELAYLNELVTNA